MAQTEPRSDVSIEQAESYHTVAITAEAIPLSRELIETCQTLGERAESDRDGDLEQLAEALHEASGEMRELADTAQYLADRP